MFKQVEFHPSRVIAFKTAAFYSITPSVNKVIFTSNRPTSPKYMGDFAKFNQQSKWKKSMLENYENMNTSGTFSAPVLRKDLPSTIKILKAQPAFKVKLQEEANKY
eukprot:15335918-Ditylum_brightwellii.AAC.1